MFNAYFLPIPGTGLGGAVDQVCRLQRFHFIALSVNGETCLLSSANGRALARRPAAKAGLYKPGTLHSGHGVGQRRLTVLPQLLDKSDLKYDMVKVLSLVCELLKKSPADESASGHRMTSPADGSFCVWG